MKTRYIGIVEHKQKSSFIFSNFFYDSSCLNDKKLEWEKALILAYRSKSSCGIVVLGNTHGGNDLDVISLTKDITTKSLIEK